MTHVFKLPKSGDQLICIGDFCIPEPQEVPAMTLGLQRIGSDEFEFLFLKKDLAREPVGSCTYVWFVSDDDSEAWLKEGYTS